MGVRVETRNDTDWLLINLDDIIYYESQLEVSIKNTLIEESDWFNTTRVTITMTRPPCDVTQAMLDEIKAQNITFKGSDAEQQTQADLSSTIIHAAETFKLKEQDNCGELDYKLIKQDLSTIKLDKQRQILHLSISNESYLGAIKNSYLEFYFKDFPDRQWKVPIEIEVFASDEFETKTEQKNTIKVSPGKLDMFGQLTITYDYLIVSQLEDVQTWSSKNLGRIFLHLQYLPSPAEVDFLELSNIDMHLEWKVISLRGDESQNKSFMTLQLYFSDYLYVSKAPDKIENDQLEVRLLSGFDSMPYDFELEQRFIEVQPQQDPMSKEYIEYGQQVATSAIVGFSLSTVALSIFQGHMV